MSDLDRREAHLLMAAIRVLAHKLQRPPRPSEVADLLEWPQARVRLCAVRLQELGAVGHVQSAYEVHLEIRDHLLVENLPEEHKEALADDLAEFERRKQAEAQKMAQLFDDGTFDRQRQDKLERMEQGLRQKTARKPNPFQEDDSG
jgi:hypothetical protein